MLAEEMLLLLVAAGLGILIGLEREFSNKDPSIRTFSLICLGSCLFTVLSLEVARNAGFGDPGRIAAQIVPGIGFLGAGAIFRSEKQVNGLTTAALIWTTAAIGMAVGLGHVKLAIWCTFTALLIMIGLRLIHRILDSFEGTKLERPRD